MHSGTGWKVAIAEGEITNIVERFEFDTTTPSETIATAKAWLKDRKFDALGIASFGPLDLDPNSATCVSVCVALTLAVTATSPRHLSLVGHRLMCLVRSRSSAFLLVLRLTSMRLHSASR